MDIKLEKGYGLKTGELETWSAQEGTGKSRPMCLFMVGLPGSGKSTMVKEKYSDNPEVDIMSSDDYIQWYADKEGKTYNEVFKDTIKWASERFDKQLASSIESGKNLIIDRTNLTKASRQRIINKLSDEYLVGYAYVATHPLEAFIRQSKREGKNIPEPTFIKMMNQLEIPEYEVKE